MAASAIACPACGASLGPGRLACQSCGELLASIGAPRRWAIDVAAVPPVVPLPAEPEPAAPADPPIVVGSAAPVSPPDAAVERPTLWGAPQPTTLWSTPDPGPPAPPRPMFLADDVPPATPTVEEIAIEPEVEDVAIAPEVEDFAIAPEVEEVATRPVADEAAVEPVAPASLEAVATAPAPSRFGFPSPYLAGPPIPATGAYGPDAPFVKVAVAEADPVPARPANRFGRVRVDLVIVERAVAAGAVLLALGIVLPWGPLMIGAPGAGNVVDTLGIVGPWHVLAFLAALGVAALALAGRRVADSVRLGLLPFGLALFALGLVWPYVAGAIGGGPGTLVVLAGVLVTSSAAALVLLAPWSVVRPEPASTDHHGMAASTVR